MRLKKKERKKKVYTRHFDIIVFSLLFSLLIVNTIHLSPHNLLLLQYYNITILYFFLYCYTVQTLLLYVRMYVCMAITCSKGKDQPGKVVNPAHGQLNRENEYFPVPVRA